MRAKVINFNVLKKRGTIIILSSPSGAGKTTLVKLLSEKKIFCISFTHNRTPRLNEKEGIDYFFIDKEGFQKLIEENEFLELLKFLAIITAHQKNIIKKLNEGQNVIFDIDWQGTEQIIKKELDFNVVTIFILPPSKKVLKERLSNRDMKDKLIVEERMKQFDKDILHWKNYNYVVINDDLKNCFKNSKILILN